MSTEGPPGATAAARRRPREWPLATPEANPREPEYWRHACRVLTATVAVSVVGLALIGWMAAVFWTADDVSTVRRVGGVGLLVLMVLSVPQALRLRRQVLSAGPWGSWRNVVPRGTHVLLGLRLLLVAFALQPLGALRPEVSGVLDSAWVVCIAVAVVAMFTDPGWGKTAPDS